MKGRCITKEPFANEGVISDAGAKQHGLRLEFRPEMAGEDTLNASTGEPPWQPKPDGAFIVARCSYCWLCVIGDCRRLPQLAELYSVS